MGRLANPYIIKPRILRLANPKIKQPIISKAERNRLQINKPRLAKSKISKPQSQAINKPQNEWISINYDFFKPQNKSMSEPHDPSKPQNKSIDKTS